MLGLSIFFSHWKMNDLIFDYVKYWYMTRLWFEHIFYCHPHFGMIPILTNILQMGRFNHQLDD